MLSVDGAERPMLARSVVAEMRLDATMPASAAYGGTTEAVG